MKLFLVRHGDYVEERVDPRCPLSPKGRADIARMASFLKQAGFSVDNLYHSGKTRAIESAQILQQTINPQALIEQKKYLAPDDSVDEIIYDVASWKKNSMVVGHMPFLARLIARLVIQDERKAIISLPTSAVVILENDRDQNWYIVGFITAQIVIKNV